MQSGCSSCTWVRQEVIEMDSFHHFWDHGWQEQGQEPVLVSPDVERWQGIFYTFIKSSSNAWHFNPLLPPRAISKRWHTQGQILPALSSASKVVLSTSIFSSISLWGRCCSWVHLPASRGISGHLGASQGPVVHRTSPCPRRPPLQKP